MKLQTFAAVTFNEDNRTVSGLAVPYGVPTRSGDLRRVQFTEGSIRFSDRILLTVQHDDSKILAATPNTLSLTNGKDGVSASATLLDTQEGRDAATNLTAGVLKGFSVETFFDEDGVERRGKNMYVTGAEMFGVSLVSKPAFPKTDAALMSLLERLPDLDAKPRKPERIVRYF